MHKYNQASGMFTFTDGATCACYSGHGSGLNNPLAEAVPGHGPIPKGTWKLTGVQDSEHTGPFSIVLEPDGFDPYGRSAFRVHGDNSKGDRSASHGCIIMDRGHRTKLWSSGTHYIQVE